MTACRSTHALPIIALVALLTSISVAAQTVERITLPASGLSEAIRHDVDEKGYRIALDNGRTAEFWFSKFVQVVEKTVPGALYPDLEPGSWIGIFKLNQNTPDYRGQSISAGTYTLRYELLPQDGNHLGVSANPDFLLAIPLAEDMTPIQPLVLKKVVEMSSKSTGGNHPAVIALAAAGPPGTVAKTEDGTVFSVAIPTPSGTEKIGICLTCSASQ